MIGLTVYFLYPESPLIIFEPGEDADARHPLSLVTFPY
jgi:hypothetical protein